MNYYKYLLFCVLAFSFIKYQYYLRTDAIIQIVLGCVVILAILEYIDIDQYTEGLPFAKSEKKINKKKQSDSESEDARNKSNDASIDNDSLELLNEDNDDEYSRQPHIPPYLNMNA